RILERTNRSYPPFIRPFGVPQRSADLLSALPRMVWAASDSGSIAPVARIYVNVKGDSEFALGHCTDRDDLVKAIDRTFFRRAANCDTRHDRNVSLRELHDLFP